MHAEADLRDLWHEWVIRVRVCEQRGDRQQDLIFN